MVGAADQVAGRLVATIDPPEFVPSGLLYDLLAVLHRHGIEWADGDNWRRLAAMEATGALVVAVTAPRVSVEKYKQLSGAEQDEVGW